MADDLIIQSSKVQDSSMAAPERSTLYVSQGTAEVREFALVADHCQRASMPYTAARVRHFSLAYVRVPMQEVAGLIRHAVEDAQAYEAGRDVPASPPPESMVRLEGF